MPKAYILVGVPASGKSTWCHTQQFDWGNTIIASTDTYVEAYATKIGKTYSEVFEGIMPTAVNHMVDTVLWAVNRQYDIIWDQTSTTVASRLKKFRMLPDYEHIAVVFQTPDEEEHQRRLKTRPGKVIPEAVLFDMVWNFEMPTEEEGFQEIWYAI
jgi:predicted kinase